MGEMTYQVTAIMQNACDFETARAYTVEDEVSRCFHAFPFHAASAQGQMVSAGAFVQLGAGPAARPHWIGFEIAKCLDH